MGKLDDLRVFAAVVERDSFVGAARQLGLSPAAVSRRIQELEARLNVKLLNRTTRRISVTDVGREVYERVAEAIAAIDEAERIAARRHETPAGVLRVVAPYAITHLAIMPLMPAFRAAYPEVRIDFIVTNQPLDLIEFGCDIGVRVGAQPNSSYVIRPLFHTDYLAVATPEWIAANPALRKPGDLARAPLAGFSRPRVSGPAAVPLDYTFRSGARSETLTFAFALAASEPIILLDYAIRSLGPAIIPGSVVESALEEGRIVRLLPDWRIDESLDVSVVYRRHATMESKTRVFLDFLGRNMRSSEGGVPLPGV